MVDYAAIGNKIRDIARGWLEKGEVKYVIGYEKGKNSSLARPAFIYHPEEVDRLIFSPTCIHNLTRFLVEEVKRKSPRGVEPDLNPIGIVVKPCDSKTIVELIKENIVPRERVKIIGVISGDTVNPKKLEETLREIPMDKRNNVQIKQDGHDFVLEYDGKKVSIPLEDLNQDKCKVCVTRSPVIYDEVVGEKEVGPPTPDNYEDLKELEDMSPEERWQFWESQLSKCVRCYACREACPLCYCEECVFDRTKPYKWIEKSVDQSGNVFYHLVRAMHLAGRCIDCGECERVCPMDIPIRKLNRFLEKKAKERFKIRPGMNAEDESMFGTYDIEDPGEGIW